MKRTCRTNTTAESTKAQTPRNARFLPLPLRISQLDPLKRTHVDRRVGKDADETGGETAEEETETAARPHVGGGLEDEGVAAEGGGTGGGHNASLLSLQSGRREGKRLERRMKRKEGRKKKRESETNLERLDRVDAELTDDSTDTTSNEPTRVRDERLVGNAVPVLSENTLRRFVREELDGRFL